MSYAYPYDQHGEPIVARATESARAAFIRRTYTHLAGAVLAFVAIEWVVFNFLLPDAASAISAARFMSSPVTWLLLLLAFVGVGTLARWWAQNGTSPGMAYAGLALYVVLEAAIFVPLLCVALYFLPPDVSRSVLGQAGVLTLALFGGLTAVVFVTRKDFSFLAPVLACAGFLIFGLIIAGMFFGGPGLSLWIAFIAVALACGSILYTTSNVMLHYRTNQHVAAALDLFAAVAYLFYNILWILIQLAGNRE